MWRGARSIHHHRPAVSASATRCARQRRGMQTRGRADRHLGSGRAIYRPTRLTMPLALGRFRLSPSDLPQPACAAKGLLLAHVQHRVRDVFRVVRSSRALWMRSRQTASAHVHLSMRRHRPVQRCLAASDVIASLPCFSRSLSRRSESLRPRPSLPGTRGRHLARHG